MVYQIGVTTGGNVKDFGGLSSDPKPIFDVGPGSTFQEDDTGKGWYFSINKNPQTNNGWWPA